MPLCSHFHDFREYIQRFRSICLCGLDISLQDLASRYPDTRSAVARDTDNALWLRYGVLQPKTQFDMQLKLARKYVPTVDLCTQR